MTNYAAKKDLTFGYITPGPDTSCCGGDRERFEYDAGEPLHSGCHHRAFNHFCRGSEFLTVTCRKSEDGMRGVISMFAFGS